MRKAPPWQAARGTERAGQMPVVQTPVPSAETTRKASKGGEGPPQAGPAAKGSAAPLEHLDRIPRDVRNGLAAARFTASELAQLDTHDGEVLWRLSKAMATRVRRRFHPSFAASWLSDEVLQDEIAALASAGELDAELYVGSCWAVRLRSLLLRGANNSFKPLQARLRPIVQNGQQLYLDPPRLSASQAASWIGPLVQDLDPEVQLQWQRGQQVLATHCAELAEYDDSIPTDEEVCLRVAEQRSDELATRVLVDEANSTSAQHSEQKAALRQRLWIGAKRAGRM